MLTELARWNRWGTAPLEPGRPRLVPAAIEPFLETREVVALVGPRRAGKSTVMYQLMTALEGRGVPKSAMLHLNLEEPSLATEQLNAEVGIAWLERAYETWRHEVYPSGRGFLFLDEVQRVPGWERWVRARSERDGIKVFVTGSSSALLSRELGTLLTGRHVSFEVQPLSFAEFLTFRGIDVPQAPFLAVDVPPIQHALLAWLRWGGFPEVALATDDRRRLVLLQQYFDDLLYRDVAMRHQVRDLPLLRALAVHLLTHSANLVSYQRLAGIFGASTEKMRTYCDHLRESWLIDLVPIYTLKTAERDRNPQKVHAVDTGLRNAVAMSASEDRGRLAETALYNALCSTDRNEVFYWRGHGELDLLVRSGSRVTSLVQVVWEGLERPEVAERERGGLEEAGAAFPDAARHLVSGSPHEGATPLWRALLHPRGLAS